jgi:hypothetical protein
VKLILKARIVVLMLSVACATLASAEAGVPIAAEGQTRIVAEPEGAAVLVVIATAKVLKHGGSDAARPSSCTASREPCSIVNALEIRVDEEHVFVPRSVLCRLSDLNTGQIAPTGSGWILKLSGGDASESYIAAIEFDRKRVTGMRVFGGMMPDKPLEETIFHMQTLGE